MQDEINKKPAYVKKADIKVHSKKRKGVTITKIKTKLQSELNLRNQRQESLNAKTEERKFERKRSKNIPTSEVSSDPLARFAKKKKCK